MYTVCHHHEGTMYVVYFNAIGRNYFYKSNQVSIGVVTLVSSGPGRLCKVYVSWLQHNGHQGFQNFILYPRTQPPSYCVRHDEDYRAM